MQTVATCQSEISAQNKGKHTVEKWLHTLYTDCNARRETKMEADYARSRPFHKMVAFLFEAPLSSEPTIISLGTQHTPKAASPK